MQTFFVGVIGIGIGLQYGLSIPTAVFCLTISLMQLIEYIVWTNYGNKIVNYQASVGASLLLWLQPIASIFTVTNETIRNSMLLGYGALSAVGQMFDEPRDYSMTRAPNGHLAWNWLRLGPGLIVYMAFLLTPVILNKNYDLFAIAVTTLAISMYTYLEQNTWGSMWCWIVNGIVLLTVGRAILR